MDTVVQGITVEVWCQKTGLAQKGEKEETNH